MRQEPRPTATEQAATSAIGAGQAAPGASRLFLRQVNAILWKDIAIEWRTRDVVISMLIFGLLALTVFNFAFDLRADSVLLVTPGVLWVAIIFAGTLGLGRSFAHEKERGSLEGLLLCPVERGAIFVAKFLVNLTYLILVEAILVIVFSGFFHVDALKPTLLLILFLGTLGFAAVGTVFAAMAANTRAREVMLPVVLFPILVPAVIASVKATGLLLDGRPWDEIWTWANILIAFDVIFLVVSFLVFEFVIEDWG